MSLFGNLKTKKSFPKGDSAHTRIAGESFSKALSKSAGKEYKKGFTKGDLLKHKKENLKLRREK